MAENTEIKESESKANVIAENNAENSKESVKKEVVVQKTRGFSHYVGFALLTFLSIVFFFIPGITLSYLINSVGSLSATAAWIISAAFSAILWLLFKLKIKGIKRASAWYIGFCGLVFLILLLVWQFSEIQIFGGIFGMLLP